MRITVKLDADVAADLKREVPQTGKPFRVVLNEAVRRGLRARELKPRAPYRLKPAALGGVMPGVNLDKALRLADTLDED